MNCSYGVRPSIYVELVTGRKTISIGQTDSYADQTRAKSLTYGFPSSQSVVGEGARRAWGEALLGKSSTAAKQGLLYRFNHRHKLPSRFAAATAGELHPDYEKFGG